MSSNNIAKSLNLTPISFEPESKLIRAPQNESEDLEADDDIQNARHGLYEALEHSRSVIDDMVSIARQSQHPKAYEILNSAIKTLADISTGLADIQLKKQRIQKRGDSNSDEDGTVVNNLFVGSTAELQHLLENLKNKKENE